MSKIKKTIRMEQEQVERVMCHCINNKDFTTIMTEAVNIGLNVMESDNMIKLENKKPIMMCVTDMTNFINKVSREHPNIDFYPYYKGVDALCQLL